MNYPQTDANPFPVTKWSLVNDAGADDPAIREKALEELCEQYWPPIYAYARRLGNAAADSQDLTQGFYSMMLTRRDFEHANRDRGSFRAYIRTAFRNYLKDDNKKRRAQKRGGDVKFISIDQEVGESFWNEVKADERANPELDFDRHFTIALLERGLELLEDKYRTDGKLKRFELLRPYLDDSKPPSYAKLAEKMNLTEEGAKSAVGRLRRDFRRILLTEIRETMGKNGDSKEELHYLMGLFS